jgi:hypothetical protein
VGTRTPWESLDLADMRACLEVRGGMLLPGESLALVEAVEAMIEWQFAVNVSSMRRGRIRMMAALERFS